MPFFPPLLEAPTIAKLHDNAFEEFLKMLLVDFLFEYKSVIFPVDNKSDIRNCNLFQHLTTVERYSGGERILDNARTKRIHWIKTILENSSKSEVNIYEKYHKKQLRTFFLVPSRYYVLIISEPKSHKNSWYVVTAYNLDNPFRMGGLLKDYRNYKRNGYKPI